MSQSSKVTLKLGGLQVLNNLTLNDISVSKATVTQVTSITSGVTINSSAGFINTFTGGSLSTSGNTSFIVTNSDVLTDSLVLCNVVKNAPAGNAVLTVNNITTGSFTLRLSNVDTVNAISGGSVKLAFAVL